MPGIGKLSKIKNQKGAIIRYSKSSNMNSMGLVFIDLKKAFDTVDHDILCKKLEHYGVQQRELSWFRSYLSNRKQLCRVNGVDSTVGEIEVGVPQGSRLGPLLLPIYIDDLPQVVQHSSVTTYTDATSPCHQSRDLTQLNEAINSDLKKLELGCKAISFH